MSLQDVSAVDTLPDIVEEFPPKPLTVSGVENILNSGDVSGCLEIYRLSLEYGGGIVCFAIESGGVRHVLVLNAVEQKWQVHAQFEEINITDFSDTSWNYMSRLGGLFPKENMLIPISPEDKVDSESIEVLKNMTVGDESSPISNGRIEEIKSHPLVSEMTPLVTDSDGDAVQFWGTVIDPLNRIDGFVVFSSPPGEETFEISTYDSPMKYTEETLDVLREDMKRIIQEYANYEWESDDVPAVPVSEAANVTLLSDVHDAFNGGSLGIGVDVDGPGTVDDGPGDSGSDENDKTDPDAPDSLIDEF